MNTRFTRRTVLSGLGSSAVLAAATGAASVARAPMGHAAASADWQAGAPDEWRRILAEALSTRGTFEARLGRYHSRHRERGRWYAKRVLAAAREVVEGAQR